MGAIFVAVLCMSSIRSWMSLLVKMSLVLVRARRSWISCRRVSMGVVAWAIHPSVWVSSSSAGASVMLVLSEGSGLVCLRVTL